MRILTYCSRQIECGSDSTVRYISTNRPSVLLEAIPPPLVFSYRYQGGSIPCLEISTGLVLIVFTYGIQKDVDLFQFLGNTIKAHKLLLCLVSETFTAEFFPQLAGSASQEGCYCRLVHSSHLRRCWSYSDWDSVSARHLLFQSCKNT